MPHPSAKTGPVWTAGDSITPLLQDQQQRWECGQPLLAEEYLAQYPALCEDREAWLDLVYSEFCLRVQGGETPTLEEYQRRFPDLHDDLRDQLDVHAALQPGLGGSNATLPAPEIPSPTIPAPASADWQEGGFPAVPGYELLGILGRGAMGVVYKARQVSLGRLVALKMVLTGQMASREELFRLEAEAQALGRLQHPHIVQIFETGSHHDHPFLALEYCPGGSLADRLRGTPLEPRLAAEMIEILARAIQSAHEQGVVHRDLKPGNVLLAVAKGSETASDDEPRNVLTRLKITDFGLAKRLDQEGHSRTGDIMGTLNYMAPEQAAGRPQDTGPRTDIFALGAILYELLTGGTPFRAPAPWQTIQRILTEDAVPPTRLQPRTPPDLENICLMCLQKSPDRRYASALELADDLRRWLNNEPVHARPVGRVERAVKWVRRRPADAAVMAVSVLATVFLLALCGAFLQMNLLRSQKETLAGEVTTLQALKESNAQEVERLEKVSDLMAYANTLGEVQAAEKEFRFPAMRDYLERCAPRSGKEDLRHFEWHYWSRVANGEKRAFSGTRCVAYSPDGKRLLTVGSGKTLTLVDAVTGRDAGKFEGISADPTAVAFSLDGTTLVATSQDGKVAFWDVARGGAPRLFQGHEGGALHVAVGPKGMFATSGDGPIKLWVTTAGKIEEFSLAGHEGQVFATAFSPDGEFLVSAGIDATARVWDVATRKEVGKLQEGRGPILSVAFSPRGDLLAIARMDRQRTIEVFDQADWKSKYELQGHTKYVRALAFSHDGKTLASADQDGVLRLWDPAEGTLRSTLPGHRDAVSCLAFPATNEPAGYLASIGKDGKVRLWDVNATQPQRHLLTGHDAAVTTIAFSPDSKRLASGDRAKKPISYIHNVGTGVRRPDFPLPHSASLSALGFTDDGKRLIAAGSLEGVDVRVWSLAEENNKALDGLRVAPGSVMAIGAGRLTVGTTDNRILIHDDTGRQHAELPGHGEKVTALASNLDGSRLASTGADGIIRVREIPSGRVIGEQKVQAGKIDRLALSADGKRVAWATPDSTLRIWTVGEDSPLLELVGHGGTVHGLSFSPDGQRLASASFDQSVRVWDTFAGRELLRLPLPWSQVNTVAFSPDGTCLAAGGGSGNRGQVAIWYAGPSNIEPANRKK